MCHLRPNCEKDRFGLFRMRLLPLYKQYWELVEAMDTLKHSH